MIYWAVFIFTLLLVWLENHNKVLNVAQRGEFFRRPTYRLICLIRPIIQYGSVIGIYFKYNIYAASIAFIGGIIFGFVPFKIYYYRQVERLIPFIKEQLKKENVTGDIDSRARRQAEHMVYLTVKQEWELSKYS